MLAFFLLAASAPVSAVAPVEQPQAAPAAGAPIAVPGGAAAEPASASPDAAPGSTAAPVSPAALPSRSVRPAGSTQPYAASARPAIGFVSAATLRDRCLATSPGVVSYCFAYVTGVHDSVRAYETWLKFREFCPPYETTQADLRRAFLAYIGQNPQAGSGEAASVVVLALKDRFACTDPQKDSAAKRKDASPGKR